MAEHEPVHVELIFKSPWLDTNLIITTHERLVTRARRFHSSFSQTFRVTCSRAPIQGTRTSCLLSKGIVVTDLYGDRQIPNLRKSGRSQALRKSRRTQIHFCRILCWFKGGLRKYKPTWLCILLSPRTFLVLPNVLKVYRLHMIQDQVFNFINHVAMVIVC